MKRTKTKPYWLIKEDRHSEQEWLRQNRRIRRRFHLDYLSMTMLKGVHRPYEGDYKQWDHFREVMKEALRADPEFFQGEEYEKEA